MCALYLKLGGNIIRCHALTGNSLLHLATKHSSLKMVKFLLEKYKEHEDFVEVKMILSGIINMKNSDGQYPLFLAAEKGWQAVSIFSMHVDAFFVNFVNLVQQLND